MPIEEGGSGGIAWDEEQKRMARIIIQVGQELGVGRRGIIVGLMTAMQESTLRNLNYGDRDSLGLFQQRPSMGWGTREQVTDPRYAARKFFTELKKVHGWQNMRFTEAAQAVQRSAFPDAYAKWHDEAAFLLRSSRGKIQPGVGVGRSPRVIRENREARQRDQAMVTAPPPTSTPAAPEQPDYTAPDLDLSDDEEPKQGVVPDVDTSIGGAGAPGMPSVLAASMGPITRMPVFKTPDEYVNATGGGRFGQKGVNNTRKGLVELAKQYVGTPYKWGGTDLETGVDCSGFIQSVYKEMGIDIPRVSYQQANYGKRVNDLSKLRPGDLVAWDNSSRNSGADHVAIYLGNGRIIEAPRTGLSVRIRKLGDNEGAWGVAMDVK